MTFRPYLYSTECYPEDPDKISKISLKHFAAFRWGVCVSNLSSLALKLWEEIEVTPRQTDRQTDRWMIINFVLVIVKSINLAIKPAPHFAEYECQVIVNMNFHVFFLGYEKMLPLPEYQHKV